MNSIASALPISLSRAAAAIAVAAAVAVAFPTTAASNQSKQSAVNNQNAATTSTSSKTQGRTSHADRVEARITELHSKLKITRQQESQWNDVAQIMRENAKTMDALAQERTAKKEMTAVED